jgi:hypothetical protein
VTHVQDLWKPLREAYGKYGTLDGIRRQGVLNVINNEHKWNAVYHTALIIRDSGGMRRSGRKFAQC